MFWEPYKELRSKNGALGFFRGLGKGIIGTITKPASGAIDFVTKNLQGIGNSFISNPVFVRRRFIRCFGVEGDCVVPYNECSSLFKYLTHYVDGIEMDSPDFFMYVLQKKGGKLTRGNFQKAKVRVMFLCTEKMSKQRVITVAQYKRDFSSKPKLIHRSKVSDARIVVLENTVKIKFRRKKMVYFFSQKSEKSKKFIIYLKRATTKRELENQMVENK